MQQAASKRPASGGGKHGEIGVCAEMARVVRF
jgi:hypothetical protein